MTTDQEHLVTLLHIKFGGFRELIDTWLYADDKFSAEELDAMNIWLHDEKTPKPMNLTVKGDGDGRFISLEFPLDTD